MPSMTPMMSDIFFELALISPMVLTTSDTTWPPLTATLAAELASVVASTADVADARTVPVSSSIDEAVDCRLLAVCSVRLERSRVPAAISVLADWMLLAELCTWNIAAFIRTMALFSWTASGECTCRCRTSSETAPSASIDWTMLSSSRAPRARPFIQTAMVTSRPVCTTT